MKLESTNGGWRLALTDAERRDLIAALDCAVERAPRRQDLPSWPGLRRDLAVDKVPDWQPQPEPSTLDELVKSGEYVVCGYDHKAGKQLVAPRSFIEKFNKRCKP